MTDMRSAHNDQVRMAVVMGRIHREAYLRGEAPKTVSTTGGLRTLEWLAAARIHKESLS